MRKILFIIMLFFLIACKEDYSITAETVTACGEYGGRCCPGSVCQEGECRGGLCSSCGFMGEPCCKNSKPACEDGTLCSSGFCQPEYSMSE